MIFIQFGAIAQIKTLKIVGGCALDEVPLPSEFQTDDIDERTNELIGNLIKRIGIQKSFVIRKADIKNAMVAQDENGTRILLINPGFLLNLKGFQSDWLIYFVLAHEIGHIVNYDPLESEKHNPEMEIAADKFAAVQLCRMGAGIEDAKSAIELLVKENTSPTYPTKKQRLFGIESGWLDAKCSTEPSDALTYDATTKKAEWKYAGKGYELGWGSNNNRNYYNVCLKIIASQKELSRISSVRYYFLHDSFGKGASQGKVFSTSTDAKTSFEHCIQIWGTFPLKVVINYKEGKQKEIDYVW